MTTIFSQGCRTNWLRRAPAITHDEPALPLVAPEVMQELINSSDPAVRAVQTTPPVEHVVQYIPPSPRAVYVRTIIPMGTPIALPKALVTPSLETSETLLAAPRMLPAATSDILPLIPEDPGQLLLVSSTSSQATANQEPHQPALAPPDRQPALPTLAVSGETKTKQTEPSQTEPARLEPIPAGAVIQPVSQSIPCLPVDGEWKKSLELQTTALQARLDAVENELSVAQSEVGQMNTALTESTQKLQLLAKDVSYWQEHTKQLEADILLQQKSDLKSLDELATAVHELIKKQKRLLEESK